MLILCPFAPNHKSKFVVKTYMTGVCSLNSRMDLQVRNSESWIWDTMSTSSCWSVQCENWGKFLLNLGASRQPKGRIFDAEEMVFFSIWLNLWQLQPLTLRICIPSNTGPVDGLVDPGLWIQPLAGTIPENREFKNWKFSFFHQIHALSTSWHTCSHL